MSPPLLQRKGPIGILSDGTELASKPFIAVGYVGCVAECYQLSAVSDGTPGAISAEDAYLLVHRSSSAVVLASHAVSRDDGPEAFCASACSRDITAAFRYGPSCYQTCGDLWLPWSTFYSAIGVRCSNRKRMIIRSIERVERQRVLNTSHVIYMDLATHFAYENGDVAGFSATFQGFLEAKNV